MSRPVTRKLQGKTEPQDRAKFDEYLYWRKLPAILKGKEDEYYAQAGIDDANMVRLLKIKTQEQFRAEYRIGSKETITRWNRKIEEEGLLVAGGVPEWLKKLTPNVMARFYQHTMRDGDAARMRTWLEYVEKWSPKQELTGPNGTALPTPILINLNKDAVRSDDRHEEGVGDDG